MAKKAVLAGALIAFNSSWKNNQNKIKEELKAHLEREQSSLRAGTKLTQSENKPTHVFAIHLVFQQKPSK